MPVQELERESITTSSQSAEIQSLQPPKEVSLAPDVGRNSRLEETGFNLSLEMGRLITNYNQNLKEGKDHLEALTLSVAETEVNVRTYIVEYIQTRTVLPHVSRLQEVDGKIRMVGLNGVPVVSGITKDERFGAALEASVNAETFLTGGGLEKTQNRVVVINSPEGHSGRISEKGSAIKYKSNQTVISWTDEKGDLQGLTIVSDLNKEQSRQLSISLGVQEDLLTGRTEEEELANIVRNPALFSYGRSITNPAKYVFEKILALRGNSDIMLEQEDDTIEHRSVLQTREDIEKFDSLLQFSHVWESFLKNLRMTILSKENNLNSFSIQSLMAKKIEETILEITADYLQEIKSKKFNVVADDVIYFKPVFESKYRDSEIRPAPIDKYAIAAAFLKTRAGCAGGGGSSVLKGSGSSSSVSSSSYIESGSGVCNVCKKPNMDNHYHCPDCKKEYADETNTERTSVCTCGFEFGCGGSTEKEEQEKDFKIIAFPGPTSKELPKAA